MGASVGTVTVFHNFVWHTVAGQLNAGIEVQLDSHTDGYVMRDTVVGGIEE